MLQAGHTHAAAAQLPTYALYGEPGRTLGVEWLHCESIAERSRLHDWEIKPHRHAALFQFLYVRKGAVRCLAEGRELRLAGPCIVSVPALTAHGFAFSPDVDGVVITVVEQHLRQLLAHEPGLADAVVRLAAQPLPAGHRRGVHAAATALKAEHASGAPWRGVALDAALVQLVLQVARLHRAGRPSQPAGAARGRAHVQRFQALVEARFREQPALAECARALGITPTQLNRVCRQVLGCSALAVLHARTVLEAQRELAYTTLSVKQIGLGLGFADAGYFTRFFKRETGRNPTQWRAASSG